MTADDCGRLPPQSIEAERSILGSILLDNASFKQITDKLQEADFYRESHRKIYAAMQAMDRKGEAIDYLTLGDYLIIHGQLEEVGGRAAITALTDEVPSAANIQHYARIVAGKATLRRLMHASSEILRAGFEESDNIDCYIVRAKQIIDASQKRTDRALNCYNLSEFLSLKFGRREEILPPIIKAQSINEVYAWRGVGKTKFVLGVGMAVATGGRFLKWKADKPRKVLHIDGELSKWTLQKWISEAAMLAGDGPSDNYKIIAHGTLSDEQTIPNIASIEGQDKIEPYLDGIELLILDNIATLSSGGDENDKEFWNPIQSWLSGLRKRDISVLFVHHAGKGGAQRGTSARDDILDNVISLQHPADYSMQEGCRFNVVFEKARDLFGQDVTPFEAKLTTGEFGNSIWVTRETDTSPRQKVIEMSTLDCPVKEITAVTGLSKNEVYQIQAEAKKTKEL
jgi:Replicative DNA helicase